MDSKAFPAAAWLGKRWSASASTEAGSRRLVGSSARRLVGSSGSEPSLSPHDKVKKLFKEYDAGSDEAFETKHQLVEHIRKELAVHMDIEETIFYRAGKKVRSEDIKDQVREADEEHHVVKVLIAELSKMRPDQEQYDAKSPS
ncbi:MAG: hemerythrin domain-containing protein [Acidobacteriota bacterium]